MAPDLGLPAPDLVLFLDLSPDKARERGGFGQERYEKEEIQARVRELFHQIRGGGGIEWEMVDAGRALEEVEEALLDKASRAVEAAKRKPLGKLEKLI